MSGWGACQVVIVIVSLSDVKTPGSRGLKPPAPRCLFIVALSTFHCRFSVCVPTGGRACRVCAEGDAGERVTAVMVVALVWGWLGCVG